MDKLADKFIASSLKWVNGIVDHDCLYVHTECLPDFSCCHPEAFEEDINKRMKSHARVVDNYRRR